MKKMVLITFLLVITTFVFTQNRYRIQKGYSIGMNFNGWQSRYFGDVYFQHRLASKFGYFISAGAGQFGNFIADGKTKKWFGHKDYPADNAYTFYKSSNIGIQTELGINYEFNLRNFLSITPSLYIINGIYNCTFEYDNGSLTEDFETQKFVPKIIKGNAIEYNIALGFNVYFEWLLSKKIRLITGGKLPFYFNNPRKLSVSSSTRYPLRGTDPVLTFGIKYNFKK